MAVMSSSSSGRCGSSSERVKSSAKEILRPGTGLMLAGLVTLAILVWIGAAHAGVSVQSIPGLSREEALRQGETIYRKGILPSGEPVIAFVQGDTPVDGTMFSCISCHMRGGFGSFEGQVLTTPTTGKYLYQPVYTLRQLTAAEKETIPQYFKPQFEAPPKRPAYTDETLAALLRGGVDPSGRTVNYVMPRYQLSDRDMSILIMYLKSLSSDVPPGVTDSTVRFATVVTEDVSPREREALYKTLEHYAIGRNNMAEAAETRSKRGFSAEWMDFAYRRKLSIARWELKGPPESWRGQLEEYYRREPVFALLGGMTHGDWKPVHDFSEEHHLPCILPITDFPVISKTDWYTLYFSKGFYQEGEAVARFLERSGNLPHDKPIVQIIDSSRAGRALSEGFQETWQEFGHSPPVNRTLPAGATISKDFLRQVTDRDKPSVILLWAGSETYPALEALGASPNRPQTVYVSASRLKHDLGKLPENARDFTFITYPYALPPGKGLPVSQAKGAGPKGGGGIDPRISSGTWSLWLVLNDALMMLGTNFYHDNFLDKIDCIEDKAPPYTDYERLSFGPGQRYLSKGCYIVQMTGGANPLLQKRSEWVIH